MYMYTYMYIYIYTHIIKLYYHMIIYDNKLII